MFSLSTMASFSELRHLNRAQDGEKDPRKQMADRRSHSRDLLGFIGNDKTWYKKCFLVPRGLGMHGPDQGCRTSLDSVGVSVLSTRKQLQAPLLMPMKPWCDIETLFVLLQSNFLSLICWTSWFVDLTSALVSAGTRVDPPCRHRPRMQSYSSIHREQREGFMQILDHPFLSRRICFILKCLQALHQSITTVYYICSTHPIV